MFGEFFLKLRQTNWNVAINNLNDVVDELPSQNNLHLFNNWYLESTALTHINTVLCVLVPFAQNGGFSVKLALKIFDFTTNTLAYRKALSESYATYAISC